MRFSEALALTPKDFDFAHQTLSISKTWDYKGKGGFQPTKNKSSVRKIQIDWQTVIQFSELVKHLPEDKPIFVNSTVYNSTVNDILGRHCKACNIPVISIHGLRHTHASLLLFTGVSIASVARRLGHSSMTTTQKPICTSFRNLKTKTSTWWCALFRVWAKRLNRLALIKGDKKDAIRKGGILISSVVESSSIMSSPAKLQTNG